MSRVTQSAMCLLKGRYTTLAQAQGDAPCVDDKENSDCLLITEMPRCAEYLLTCLKDNHWYTRRELYNALDEDHLYKRYTIRATIAALVMVGLCDFERHHDFDASVLHQRRTMFGFRFHVNEYLDAKARGGLE